MFDPALAVEVMAAPPPIPDLGQQNQILQLFGGIIALLAFALGALSWLRGERRPPPSPPAAAAAPAHAAATEPALDSGVHLYFSGPLAKIDAQLDKLDVVLDRLTAIAEGVSKNKALHYEARELFATALRETRHDIRNAVHMDALAQSGEIDDLKTLIGNLRDIVVRLDEFMRHRRGG